MPRSERPRLLVVPGPNDSGPDRFGIAGRLPPRRLPRSTTLVTSETDPWMKAARARRWEQRWVRTALRRSAREQRPHHADWTEWSFAW